MQHSTFLLDERNYRLLRTAVREKDYNKVRIILENIAKTRLPTIDYAEMKEDGTIAIMFSRSVRLPKIVRKE